MCYKLHHKEGMLMGKFINGSLVALFALVLFAGAAQSSEVEKRYYEIKEAGVQFLGESEVLPEVREDMYSESSMVEELNEAEVIVDKVINIGKKIWAIIEKNRPVVNIKTEWASAMPEGVKNWRQLENWSMPKSYDYRYYAKNYFGMTVIDVTYRVMFIHGGSVKGKGSYVANATVVPVNVHVAWGFRLDMDVKIPGVFNVGSHENPVGAVQQIVSAKVTNALTHEEIAGTYSMNGRGEFQDNN